MAGEENAQGQTDDVEVKAISNIIAALDPLEDDARTRVIAYVFSRLDISPPAHPFFTVSASQPLAAPMAGTAMLTPPTAIPAHGPTDVRTLKEQKNPKTATEMAAIVAYYLTELAPAADRKSEVDSEDITKYFKQAGYPLGKATKTLFDAKSAGYLDNGSARGMYKLNPVGHNLVVHYLPGGGTDKGKSARRTKARTGGKKAR